MISLPVLLVLEEERMKRRKSENQNHNLLMTQPVPKSKPPSDNGKIHHFYIRKENSKNDGQIGK